MLELHGYIHEEGKYVTQKGTFNMGFPYHCLRTHRIEPEVNQNYVDCEL